MSEEEAAQLLAAARLATDRAAASRATADADSAERRRAVQACMDAGIPRQEIADAIGAHISVVYRITR